MKIKYIIKGLAALSLTVAMSGCEKDFLDVNTDPNSPTTTTTELVLPNALANSGAVTNNTFNILGNFLAGNWAQAPDFAFYSAQETYNFDANTYDAAWQSIYAGGLNDYKYVEIEATKGGKKNALAISQIMQAYNFQLLVDNWGDVPYTEALQGTALIAPKYDKAEDIYDGILTMINTGIGNIDVSATSDKPGTSDIVFGGDMAKWRKFANTLKLRVLLRQSLVASRTAKVTAGFSTLSGATYLAAGENAGTNPGYLNQAGKFSPIYGAIGFSVTGTETNNYLATKGNKFAIDFLTTTADPRLPLLYRPAKIGGAYVGVYPGTIASTNARTGNFSPIGPAIVPLFSAVAGGLNNNGTYNGNINGFAKPGYLISAAESFFLQAEAMLKGFIPGGAAGAQAAYQAGIDESFKLDGSTAAAAQAYYGASTSPLVSWTAAAAAGRQFEAIITQKWVANNGINGNEAWAELRRTGFPTGTPIGLTNISAGRPPLRIPYVQTERAGNKNNVPSVNIFTDKIFWQK